MSELRKRDYPSLRRKGTSIGGGGSFKPTDTLGTTSSKVILGSLLLSGDMPVETSSKSESRLTESSTVLGDPNRSLERARICRRRLSGLNSLPSETATRTRMAKSNEVTDCYGFPIDLDLKMLNGPPEVYIDLRSVRKVNGESFRTGPASQISLGVSKNGKYICVYKNSNLQPGFVINIDEQLKSLSFALTSIIMELNGHRETIVALHYGFDNDLRDYFHEHPCVKVDPHKTLSNGALQKLNKNVEVIPDIMDAKDDGPQIVDMNENHKNEVTDEIFTRLRTRHEKKAYWDNVSKSNNSDGVEIINSQEPSVTESMFDEEDYVAWETPAKFDPDLRYMFPDGNMIRVSHDDFATLYNNSWINDAVMDFCIKYDIEVAIKAGLVKREEIHAFNSFFYTKLNSKTRSGNQPEYYQNVKRWVQKLDLMSIPYLVMPINEKHHWYCCIIRGLPTLLQNALSAKNEEKSGEEVSSESADDDGANETSKKQGAEIYVFDSLGLRRDNVKTPLKSFLIDYCKDKYSVEIQKDQIRVISAKVPRQNNYNDCGIHVIYNIKKWLTNLEDCETLWRKHQPSSQKGIFVAEERNNMRRYWIDEFLKLHSQQQSFELNNLRSNSGELVNGESGEAVLDNTNDKQEKKDEDAEDADDDDDDDDDDEIEIIQETIIQSPSVGQNVANRTRNSRFRDNGRMFENNYLNDTYNHHVIPEFVIKTLNETLPQRTLCLEMNIKKHIEQFIANSRWAINSEDALRKFIEEFKSMVEESEKDNRPKNKIFKIEEQVTSGVSHLSITPSSFFAKPPNGGRKKLFDNETVKFLTEKSISKKQEELATSDINTYDELKKGSSLKEEEKENVVQKDGELHTEKINELDKQGTTETEYEQQVTAINNVQKLSKNLIEKVDDNDNDDDDDDVQLVSSNLKTIPSRKITRSMDRERAKVYVLLLEPESPNSPKRRRLE